MNSPGVRGRQVREHRLKLSYPNPKTNKKVNPNNKHGILCYFISAHKLFVYFIFAHKLFVFLFLSAFLLEIRNSIADGIGTLLVLVIVPQVMKYI